MNNLGDTLAKLRRRKKLRQGVVADWISDHSQKSWSFKALSGWELGSRRPEIEAFLLLCYLYDVEDIYATFGVTPDDKPFLNEAGHGKVAEYVELLLESPKYRKGYVAPDETDNADENAAFGDDDFVPNKSGFPAAPGRIKLFDVPAAAGFGSFLDSDSFEEIDFDDLVPEGADYAIRVSGDSMTPRFINGQIVFISKQDDIEIGDIGIFALNGEAYIKKLAEGELISLNKKYKPIKFTETDSLTVLGKVLA